MLNPSIVDQVAAQYATEANLRMRQSIQAAYSVPAIDYHRWSLSRLDLVGDERILDIGCGPGTHYAALMEMWPDVRYIGIDASRGMLDAHPAPASTLFLGDIQHLPFAEDSFDIVMANHMLYHVADLSQALASARHVLHPAGMLMATTNSTRTMPEFQVLLRRAIVLLSHLNAEQIQPPGMLSDRFSLESGTRILSRHFRGVIRHDLPGALVFHAAEPALAYLESTRGLREFDLPADVAWDDIMLVMRQQIEQLITYLGDLTVNKLSGVLLASDRGGFLGPYPETGGVRRRSS
jgi:SAM-dependent methyltransferase